MVRSEQWWRSLPADLSSQGGRRGSVVIHVSAVLNGQQLFQERGRLARSTLSHQPIAPQHPLSKKTGDHHFPRTLVRQMDDFF